MNAPETPALDSSRTLQRQRMRRVLFLVVPVLVVIAGVYLWFVGGRYVSTDNAYVKANMVDVGAEVSGKIMSVNVRENQRVRAGDLLLRIDPRPYEVALHDAQARLEQSRMQVGSLKAAYAQKRSGLAAARDDLRFAETQLRRVKNLHERDAVSRSALDQAQHDLDVARNTVNKLQSEGDETLVQLGGKLDRPLERHPAVMAAQAALEQAQLNLQRCSVQAPINGVASKVPEIGQYATPGLPMISVVADQDTWIEANFKEDQLAGIHPGAEVEVEIDAYPGERWTATVQSIGQATGAEFSLLPPQNATGNWVKVVQRLPVRLAIEHHEHESELRSGLSAEVTIDTGIPDRAKAIYSALGLSQAGEQATQQASLAVDHS